MPQAKTSRGPALRPVLSAVALLAVAACADAPAGPRQGVVTLQTDAAAYTALRAVGTSAPTRYTLEMVVAVTNDTDREIALQACGENGDSPRFAVSMARIRADWAAAYENAWSCNEPTYLVLAVGESRVDRIELVAPRAFDLLTGDAIGDLEGEMRLAYYVADRALWSNAFAVKTDSIFD